MVENGKIDHYFPQWLMRNWCTEQNEIWCFDKSSQRVKKKGTKHFGGERDLNKSNLLNLDLEATVFRDVDDHFSTYTNALLLYSFFGKTKRVPNDIMRFFAELCLWTSARNKSVREWANIDEFREEMDSEDILYALTDDELKKAIHLEFCKICHEGGVVAQEADRLVKECYCFFAVSDNKFITSDMPVQEIGMEDAGDYLDCGPIEDDKFTLILFPVDPSVMFVATQHTEFSDCQRKFVLDERLIEANYAFHTNSDSSQVYFPYPVYEPPNLPAVPMSDVIRKKVQGVPCAVDLDQKKEEGEACIVYSNWTGKS